MLRRFHRLNACALGVFIALHLINHFAVVLGIGHHLSLQSVLRQFYRQLIVEVALIGLFTAQILLGIALVFKRGRPSGGWAWAQVVSGLYLAFFLVQHLAAVILARSGGLDTNSYFAAAVVSRPPFVYYFAAYYGLAITALFMHVSAAFRFRVWPDPAKRWHFALPFLGALIGSLIVLGFMGQFSPFELPAPYLDYLNQFSAE